MLEALPEQLSGAAFLNEIPGGTGDTVTSVDPHAVYAVRLPTRHPVYEHFRVQAFAELLHRNGSGTSCALHGSRE